MESVATTTSDDIDDPALIASVFGGSIRGGDTEFLNGFVHLERDCLVSAGCDVVRTVEQEVVRAGALAGDAERCTGKRGASLNVVSARSQAAEGQKVAIVERQRVKLVAGDDSRDGAAHNLIRDLLAATLDLLGFGLAGSCHRLLFQWRQDDTLVADVDGDASADIDFGRAFDGGDTVTLGGRNFGEVVGAVVIAGGGARDT